MCLYKNFNHVFTSPVDHDLSKLEFRQPKDAPNRVQYFFLRMDFEKIFEKEQYILDNCKSSIIEKGCDSLIPH